MGSFLLLLGAGAFLLPWNLLRRRQWAWRLAVPFMVLGALLALLAPALGQQAVIAAAATGPLAGRVLLLQPSARRAIRPAATASGP